MAHKQGWECYGFEPFEPAAEELRKKGFDVRGGWSLETAGFSESYFDAITATDVFCYVHEPFTTLAAFYRLLKPAGTLVMRVSNKRVILGLVRAFTLKGPGRDAKLSGMLQEQFHSVSVTELKTILKSIGFDFVKIIPGATTAPWRSLSYKTRAAYLIAALIEFLTFGLIEISPGVVILARKK